MELTSTVAVALYGWPLVVAFVFALLGPSWSVLVSYLMGWLFLPVAGTEVFGFFDYSKDTAVPLAITLAIAVFDGGRLARLRLRWIDLPMIAFCGVPLASSLSNGLGWYDGLSGVLYRSITWGLPYLAGRLYCTSPEGLKRLAITFVAGGLVYVPLCLWEVRMSPQLHHMLYGAHQHDWLQVFRGGGYRPTVFMHHGLMVGLWMAAASMVAMGAWASGAARRMWGFPAGLVVTVLVATTLLCKSTGAILLLAAGTVVLLLSRSARVSLPMLLLVCLPPTYVAARIAGDWSGDGLVALAGQISEERAESLAFRFEAEERLRVRAMERPTLGWGGWNRSFVRRSDDPEDTELAITDSLWIIIVGKYGLVGLVSLLLLFAAPVIRLWRACPPSHWTRPDVVHAWALALVFTLYAIDNLVNAMHNPLFLVIAGGLCGLAPTRPDAMPETDDAAYADDDSHSASARRTVSFPAGVDIR